MEELIDKISVSKAFSKAAYAYDSLALLQKRLCKELFDRIAQNNFCPKSILDIGMGTGLLMQKLSQLYCDSKIVGIDLAFGMSKFARKNNLAVMQADAECLPFKNSSFDLVVSNLVYQWLDNLETAFFEVSRVMRQNGSFYFTFFGSETLRELRSSFAGTKKGQHRVLFNNTFKPEGVDGARMALEKNHFREIEISTKIERENFKDLFSLVGWLKSIGANRITKPLFMGKGIWQEANEIYSANFKDKGLIYATFELIKVKAKK